MKKQLQNQLISAKQPNLIITRNSFDIIVKMAKLRMANASTHGARKPPGPKLESSPLAWT